MAEGINREIAKYWWLRCVACSEASMTTQMRGFGYEEPVYEESLHAFSGGFMLLGYASGLLTGAVLATGFAAQLRFGDDETRSGATLSAAIQLAKAFPDLSGAINCREITDTDLTKIGGRIRYYKEGKGRMCGRLHLKWAPLAHKLIDEALVEYGESKHTPSCANCAVRTMQEIKSLTETGTVAPVLMAGFAGGVGLSGNFCAALASGVYNLAYIHQSNRKKEKRDSRIRGSVEELFGTKYRGALTRLRFDFTHKYGSELCVNIIGRRFNDVEDHNKFVKDGGCENVAKFISDWVSEQSNRPINPFFSNSASHGRMLLEHQRRSKDAGRRSSIFSRTKAAFLAAAC